MTNRHPNRNIWLCTCVMLALAVAVCMAERSGALTSTRMALHTALSPGRLAVLALSPNSESPQPTTPDLSESEVAELQNALLENELQRRKLLIDNARLLNELRSMKKLAPLQSVTGRDLIDFIALKANVLSQSGLPKNLTEAFIDIGRSGGLRESQLVINGEGLIIDKGKDHGLTEGQKVAHGIAVIGRITEASQWVGLVQTITHPQFSAAVQVVKLEPQGAAFGARGLLEGTGESLCRITGVAYTDAVAVGDEVFSADLNGVNGPRLYYGKVVKAEFSSGGEWDIQVEPAFHANELNEVAVIQQRLSNTRTQASQADHRALRESR